MFLPLQIMGFLRRMAFASAGRALPVEEDNSANSEDSLHQKRDKPKTKVCHHVRPRKHAVVIQIHRANSRPLMPQDIRSAIVAL
jgi:hypothetical protein